jgi:tetratricopeptide (TPR) repeat protein
MALLAIKVEDSATLPLNEFYDYQGTCYALTRTRDSVSDICIELEDFYDGTVTDETLEHVDIVFVDGGRVIGWYRDAQVSRRILRPTLFLEGNVTAGSGHVWLLPEKMRQYELDIDFGSRLYSVIEETDPRYADLEGYLDIYHGENIFQRAASVHVSIGREYKNDFDMCINQCIETAERVMKNECTGISEICMMAAYAQQAELFGSAQADPYYYEAMAQYQLGDTHRAMKAVNNALKLEPDGNGIKALKACILYSMGHGLEGAALMDEVWLEEGDEVYLLNEGRILLYSHHVAEAFECFARIGDDTIREELGI